MATYHVRMSVGHGAKGAAHFEYIERGGKYRRGDKIYSETGNLPNWAASPKDFWERVSAHDKRSYREIEFALPNELDTEEQKRIVQEFVRDYLPDKAYTIAIHEPNSRIKGEKNPHVHVMFSERIIDDRVRNMTEEDFFKQHGITSNGIEYGGAIKDRQWAGRSSAALRKVRQEIADRINAAYERNGLDVRISAKSIKEQKVERYQAGDIEGAEQFKREKPYRAPVASFIRHAKEIAAVSRGELDPETIKDPAARLRAYQEQEKTGVMEIAGTLREMNAELSPNEAEIFMALDTEEQKLRSIVDGFASDQEGAELAAWYAKRRDETKKKKETLRQKLRKEIGEGRDIDIRDYSLMKAEDQIEKASPLPRAKDPKREIRAIGAARYNTQKKIGILEKETLEALIEKEADRRTGGKLAALNKELAALEYTVLPRPVKDEKRKELSEEKEKLMETALTPKDYGEFRQRAAEAEKKIWNLRRMADRLEIHLETIAKEAGLSRDDVDRILTEQAEERTAREQQKERAVLKEPVRPEVPEPEELKRDLPSPASAVAEKKEKTAYPRRRETPDMRAVVRAIGDRERTIARAEKKIAALGAKTMQERMEEEVDRLTGGRLTALKEKREAARNADGRIPAAAEAEFARERDILLRAKITPAVRKKLEKDAATDAARAKSLFRYVRRTQKQTVDLRTVLAVLQAADRLNKDKARLEELAALKTEDFLKQAIREYGASPALPTAGGKRTTPDEAVKEFYEANLPQPVRARAVELEEANRQERERLSSEIARLEKQTEIREPFVSSYQEKRKELLQNAAKRRAFLYEDAVLKLNRDPKKLSYWFDETIDRRTDGELSHYVRIWTDADQSVRRMEASKEQAAPAVETLQTWKEVWEKKPLRPMKGTGHRTDAVIRTEKKRRQEAQAAVSLLRKDYNTSEIWQEARRKYDERFTEERLLMKEVWERRRQLEKDMKRQVLAHRARMILSRIAGLADRLLGPKARGESLGASVCIRSRDIELGPDIQ